VRRIALSWGGGGVANAEQFVAEGHQECFPQGTQASAICARFAHLCACFHILYTFHMGLILNAPMSCRSTIIRPGRPGAQPMSAAHPVASAAAPSDPPAGLHSTAQQAAPSTLPPQRAAAVLTANSRAPPALSMPSQQPTSHYVRNMSNLLPGAPLASEPQLAAHFTAQLTLSHLAMAHTSSCITVLTLDGRVIFQNGAPACHASWLL
jgi:hypothetical protein